MDPITMAIVKALGKLGETVINDAYNALKVAIAKKCGADSDLVEAIENLEEKPNSAGRREMLTEEVAAAKVEQDTEILQAAKALLDQLKGMSNGSTVISQRAGDNAIQIGQVGGHVNIQQ